VTPLEKFELLVTRCTLLVRKGTPVTDFAPFHGKTVHLWADCDELVDEAMYEIMTIAVPSLIPDEETLINIAVDIAEANSSKEAFEKLIQELDVVGSKREATKTIVQVYLELKPPRMLNIAVDVESGVLPSRNLSIRSQALAEYYYQRSLDE
jgi:hypothetical protein